MDEKQTAIIGLAEAVHTLMAEVFQLEAMVVATRHAIASLVPGFEDAYGKFYAAQKASSSATAQLAAISHMHRIVQQLKAS